MGICVIVFVLSHLYDVMEQTLNIKVMSVDTSAVRFNADVIEIKIIGLYIYK